MDLGLEREKKSYLGILLAGLCVMVWIQTEQADLHRAFCFLKSSADVVCVSRGAPGVNPQEMALFSPTREVSLPEVSPLGTSEQLL